MKRYKIEKLSIKEGCYSGVRTGSSSTGRCLYAEFGEDDEKVLDIESPNMSDIKVGGYLLVAEDHFFFNKTSEIINIIDTTEDSITFETTTSIYKLGIENEQ